MMKHNYFLKSATLLSQESKCVSKQVGAILVHEYRTISTGYNGTPAGHVNCNQVFDPKNFDREEHHKFSLQRELHAEANAIAFAAKHGIATDDSTMYCTLEPCDDCLKLMIAAGVKKAYYLHDYDYADKNNPLRQDIQIEKITNEDLEKFLEMLEKLK